MKKKFLVTGAGGYIGRYVVKELIDKEQDVFAADLCLQKVDDYAKKVTLDIFEDDTELFEKLGSPEICIHLAWKDGFVHNSEEHMKNIYKHIKFINYLVEKGLKQIVVLGTMHEIGYHEGVVDETTSCNPVNQYGIAKNALRQSLFCTFSKQNIIFQWIRAFYIYGDDKNNHSIFTKIYESANKGNKSFPFVTGNNKFDFIRIDELANQIVSVALQDKIDGIINCCSGKPVSLREMVEKYIEDNNLDIELNYGAFPDRPYDSPIIYGSNKKINDILQQLKGSE